MKEQMIEEAGLFDSVGDMEWMWCETKHVSDMGKNAKILQLQHCEVDMEAGWRKKTRRWAPNAMMTVVTMDYAVGHKTKLVWKQNVNDALS